MRWRTICVVLTSTGLGAVGAPVGLAAAAVNSGGAAYSATPAVPVAAPPPAPVVPGVQGLATTPAPTLPAITGGQAYGVAPVAVPQVTVPGLVAKILPSGLAAAPAGAPAAVQQAIFAANQIVGRPYVYGGGHQAFISSGYDCSGTVSFALHGANLLAAPMDSSGFMRWGQSGVGQWITIFSNTGHVYMNIAGLRLDTSAAGDPSGLPGPRWRPLLHTHAHFRVRSILGF